MCYCSVHKNDAKAPNKIRVSRIITPMAIEMAYQKEIRRIVNIVKDAIKSNIVVNLPQLVALNDALRPTIDKLDQGNDVGQKIADLYGATRLQVESEISAIEINRIAEKVSIETSDWNRNRVHSVFKQALGINLLFNEPWLAEELKIFAINNANLITNVSSQFIAQTEQLVFEGMRKGWRHEVVAKKLIAKRGAVDELGRVSRFSSAITRANLIARDQTSKLNGNLSHLRQVGTGITHYFWRDSNDIRVRITHRSFDGFRFSWKKGAPGNIHPGDEIQCRCWGEPDFSTIGIGKQLRPDF